jgi:nucleotide-binding universal stress UspA family protein
MQKKQIRILLALDGSNQAFEMGRYISEFLLPDRIEANLLHVMSKIPESFWDIEKDPAFRNKLAGARVWEIEQKGKIREYMEKVRKLFVDRGTSEEALNISIETRKVGIARDIAHESQHDYDAVAMGARGMSELKDLVFGSTASKLISRLTHVPVCVVKGKPQVGRILVAMDASEGAMKAVDFVGKIVSGLQTSITLFHVSRGPGLLSSYYDSSRSFSEWQEWATGAQEEFNKAEQNMRTIFKKALDRLVKAGIGQDQIEVQIERDIKSRAWGIVQEAQKEGCGTIVIGRRGLSQAEEFFMGRVSDKVLHLAEEMAVWVVS